MDNCEISMFDVNRVRFLQQMYKHTNISECDKNVQQIQTEQLNKDVENLKQNIEILKDQIVSINLENVELQKQGHQNQFQEVYIEKEHYKKQIFLLEDQLYKIQSEYDALVKKEQQIECDNVTFTTNVLLTKQLQNQRAVMLDQYEAMTTQYNMFTQLENQISSLNQ